MSDAVKAACVSFFLAASMFVAPACALETGDVLVEDLRQPWTGDLDGMQERGTIRVLVPYSKTFYFVDGGALRGITAEFLREFEIKINKKRKKSERITVSIIPTARDKLLPDLVAGHGDVVVGNLTITPKRQQVVDFSDPFLKGIQELVVTSKSAKPIETFEDLAGRTIHVRQSSSYYESLLAANEKLKERRLDPIEIVEAEDVFEDEDLLEMVQADMIPAIVVDSHKIAFWLQIFPKLVAHDKVPLREGGHIAWAFRKDSPGLAAEINGFVKTAHGGTSIGATLMRRYFKNKNWLNGEKIKENQNKLDDLIVLFKRYGEKYKIDWLLVAAISFQESNFDQSRRNPSGAVGLMQIKPSTARDPNVNIRGVAKDPEKNVHAGVKYIRFIGDHYFGDEAIDDANRVLLALAAYNAGPNRVARERKKARDPNVWFGSAEWAVAKRAGMEPVKYVSNIYKYYVFFRGLEAAQDRGLPAE